MSILVQDSTHDQTLSQLRPGDEVQVWDCTKGVKVWLQIADVKESEGRTKIRATGSTFYFDASVIVAHRATDIDTENSSPFPEPFTVEVTQSERGNIGIHSPLTHCECCGARTRRLFNVGTSLYPRFVCYDCRFPEYERRAA